MGFKPSADYSSPKGQLRAYVVTVPDQPLCLLRLGRSLSSASYLLRRRNYAAHAIEMGHDLDREPPFFFRKILTTC